jgi:hypothetical protein
MTEQDNVPVACANGGDGVPSRVVQHRHPTLVHLVAKPGNRLSLAMRVAFDIDQAMQEVDVSLLCGGERGRVRR